MKPSPAKLNSHNYEKSTSLQALENMKKASNFSEISNNQGSHSSPSLLTRNIDRIMDLEQKVVLKNIY